MARFPSVGDQFGGYRIIRQLGRGGMGVVFAAEQLGLGRTIALKVLSPDLAEQDDYRHRFAREATVLARLDSPHVIQIYDHGEHDGCLYIATQYVAGGDLSEAVSAHGPVPVAPAATIAAQLAWALEDAHDAGIVHRDLKPSNVLLRNISTDVFAYLCDFGIAQDRSPGLTAPGSVAGTFAYLAPERLRGEPATPRADLYALGCVLWTSLTGRTPYAGTDVEIGMAHLNAPVPQLAATSAVAAAINEVLHRSLAKDPAQRYPGAAAMRAGLLDLERLARVTPHPPLVPLTVPRHTAVRPPAPGGPSGASHPSRPSHPTPLPAPGPAPGSASGSAPQSIGSYASPSPSGGSAPGGLAAALPGRGRGRAAPSARLARGGGGRGGGRDGRRRRHCGRDEPADGDSRADPGPAAARHRRPAHGPFGADTSRAHRHDAHQRAHHPDAEPRAHHPGAYPEAGQEAEAVLPRRAGRAGAPVDPGQGHPAGAGRVGLDRRGGAGRQRSRARATTPTSRATTPRSSSVALVPQFPLTSIDVLDIVAKSTAEALATQNDEIDLISTQRLAPAWLDGERAARIRGVYRNTADDLELAEESWLVMRGRFLYRVTFQFSRIDTLAERRALIDPMVVSFRWSG